MNGNSMEEAGEDQEENENVYNNDDEDENNNYNKINEKINFEYKCDVENCTKQFKAKKSLRDHLKIHNGIKPYQWFIFNSLN